MYRISLITDEMYISAIKIKGALHYKLNNTNNEYRDKGRDQCLH